MAGPVPIGVKLKAARLAAGLTLAEVARSQGGISAAGVSLIETGKRKPGYDTLLALARLYKIVIVFTPNGAFVDPFND